MLVYAGIDEAGYGPLLGPLCVACTAFILPDHDPGAGAPNMWSLLKRSVCRAGADKPRRIAVDDSKKLKGPNDGPTHPLRRLERGVLAFSGAESPIQDDDSLFAVTGTSAPSREWYRSVSRLPVANDADLLCIDRARLTRAMQDAGIAHGMIACEAIDAAEFNREVGRVGNKASVNFSAAMRHVDRVWRKWPNDHPRIIIDRQGGRTHYREVLQLCYPHAQLTILHEDEVTSRYRLEEGGRLVTITFTTEAESKHFPVALASMTAKYVRELLMIRLNRFFQAQVPELKPTAGYLQDARRYLADIRSVVDQPGFDRALLVRQA